MFNSVVAFTEIQVAALSGLTPTLYASGTKQQLRLQVGTHYRPGPCTSQLGLAHRVPLNFIKSVVSSAAFRLLRFLRNNDSPTCQPEFDQASLATKCRGRCAGRTWRPGSSPAASELEFRPHGSSSCAQLPAICYGSDGLPASRRDLACRFSGVAQPAKAPA